jgi:hypothetical protein
MRAIPANAELSRSRWRQCTDEDAGQRISKHLGEQNGRRLSAQVKG